MTRITLLTLVLVLSSVCWGQSAVLQGPHIYTVDFGQVPVGTWSSDYYGVWWPLWVTNPGAVPLNFSAVNHPDNVTAVPMCQLPWIMPPNSGCLVYLSVKPKRRGLDVQAVIKVNIWLTTSKTDVSQPVQLVADGK